MHICATNICVWIRTLVLESLKEITIYHQNRAPNAEDGAILDSIRQHSLRHAGTVLGTHLGPDAEWEPIDLKVRGNLQSEPSNNNLLSRIIQSTVRPALKAVSRAAAPYITETSTSTAATPSTSTLETTTMIRKLKKFISSTAASTSTGFSTTTTPLPTTSSSLLETTSADFINRPSTVDALVASVSSSTAAPLTTTQESIFNNIFAGMENAYQTYSGLSHNDTQPAQPAERSFESLDSLFPEAYTANDGGNLSCGRVSIMGTIVQDSAPYLYPFIIEYSLIGAIVIYVMWKNIGRYPKSSEEDLEHRLEVMLSRRAVAMAQKAQSGRVDCVGASKGLFFGLLLLVGSLICLILFFVLVRHPQFSLLAIYLADVSHCTILGLAILAILIGFCR